MTAAETAAVKAEATTLAGQLCSWIDHDRLPPWCLYCEGDSLWRNGVYKRSASLRILGCTVYFTGILGRRVACKACRRGYRLRADGIIPHKHYQPCVISSALNQCVLSTPPPSLADTANAHSCTPWTVARWVHWVSRMADPAWVTRLTCLHVQQEIKLRLPTHPVPAETPAEFVSQSVLAETEATLTESIKWVCSVVLVSLETLASALGLSRPGLLGVLKRFVSNRAYVATYRCPVIPEFAADKPP